MLGDLKKWRGDIYCCIPRGLMFPNSVSWPLPEKKCSIRVLQYQSIHWGRLGKLCGGDRSDREQVGALFSSFKSTNKKIMSFGVCQFTPTGLKGDRLNLTWRFSLGKWVCSGRTFRVYRQRTKIRFTFPLQDGSLCHPEEGGLLRPIEPGAQAIPSRSFVGNSQTSWWHLHGLWASWLGRSFEVSSLWLWLNMEIDTSSLDPMPMIQHQSRR